MPFDGVYTRKETEAVEAGIRLLDEKLPGWRARVAVARLDISSGTKCVLGQCFGRYDYGLVAIGIVQEDAPAFGFNVMHEGGDVDFSRIQAAWEERLSAG